VSDTIRTTFASDADMLAYARASAVNACRHYGRHLASDAALDVASDAVMLALADARLDRQYIAAACGTLALALARITGTRGDASLDAMLDAREGATDTLGESTADASAAWEADPSASMTADPLADDARTDVRTWRGWSADMTACTADIVATFGDTLATLRTEYQCSQDRGSADNTVRMVAATLGEADAHILATLDRPAGSHAACCGLAAGAVRIARMRAKSRAAGKAGADVARGGHCADGSAYNARH
jgi:hypothetical protein